MSMSTEATLIETSVGVVKIFVVKERKEKTTCVRTKTRVSGIDLSFATYHENSGDLDKQIKRTIASCGCTIGQHMRSEGLEEYIVFNGQDDGQAPNDSLKLTTDQMNHFHTVIRNICPRQR